MSIESLADKSVEIHRATVTTTPSGAYEESFEILETIQARIQPLSATEMVKLGREATDIGIRLYCLPTSIQEPDRIVYGSRIFRVIGVRNIDEQDRLMTVDCVEVL